MKFFILENSGYTVLTDLHTIVAAVIICLHTCLIQVCSSVFIVNTQLEMTLLNKAGKSNNLNVG